METLEETYRRIKKLEEQVDILRRAIGLLIVSGEPTIKWLDAKFVELEK